MSKRKRVLCSYLAPFRRTHVSENLLFGESGGNWVSKHTPERLPIGLPPFPIASLRPSPVYSCIAGMSVDTVILIPVSYERQAAQPSPESSR